MTRYNPAVDTTCITWCADQCYFSSEILLLLA